MAKYISTKIANKQSVLASDSKGELLNERVAVAIDASLALNDIVIFGKLPSGCELVDSIVMADALDSSTGLRATFGVLNDAADGIVSGTEILTTAAIGNSSAATFNRPVLASSIIPPLFAIDLASDKGTKNQYVATKFSSSTYNVGSGDRILAAKITTAATGTKAAGNITLSYTYKGM